MILVTENKCFPIWETVTGYNLDKKEKDIDICVYHLHRALYSEAYVYNVPYNNEQEKPKRCRSSKLNMIKIFASKRKLVGHNQSVLKLNSGPPKTDSPH